MSELVTYVGPFASVSVGSTTFKRNEATAVPASVLADIKKSIENKGAGCPFKLTADKVLDATPKTKKSDS